MIIINLSKGDFFLLEKMDIPEQINKLSPALDGSHMVLKGAKEQFEVLMDVVSNELCVNGFSSNFEPTEYGRALEGLIDILSVIYD